jgi:metal-sulfur cluster biosynthetic enzyme
LIQRELTAQIKIAIKLQNVIRKRVSALHVNIVNLSFVENVKLLGLENMKVKLVTKYLQRKWEISLLIVIFQAVQSVE